MPLSALAMMLRTAAMVGTRYVWASSISRRQSSSMKMPCSMESMPARTAFRMPCVPCAWLAVLLRKRLASCTPAFISSKL
ncbi:hypothetical protein D3C71_1830210 [compost metagenome]